MSSFISRGCQFSKSFLLDVIKPFVNHPSTCQHNFHNGLCRRLVVKVISQQQQQQQQRHYHSMSSRINVNDVGGRDGGDANQKPVTKRKYSALLRSDVKRKRTLSHSETLEETDPLSPSEKLTLEKWKGLLSKTKHYYEAIFVLGPMCSGKTRTIHEFKSTKQYKKFAYIDTDEIMEGLDGYDHKRVDVFYPSARRVSIHLTDWLLDERMSFIAEGTCVLYDELEDYMIRLKEKGYDIKVKKIDKVELDVVLERSGKRIRYVSPDVIKDIYTNSNIGLQKLWEKNRDNFLFEELEEFL